MICFIRQEAGLPLLPVVQELRRAKERDDLEQFERFAAVLGKWNSLRRTHNAARALFSRHLLLRLVRLLQRWDFVGNLILSNLSLLILIIQG